MTRIRVLTLAISTAVFGLLSAAAATSMAGAADTTQQLVAAGSGRPAAHVTVLARIADAGRIADSQDHAGVLGYHQQVRQAKQQAAEDAAKAKAQAAAKAASQAQAAQAAQARAAQATPAPTPAAAPPAAPQSIPDIINAAFAPLGPDAVTWALRVANCESRYNPNAVNASTGASGLFQFLPSTWAGSPEAGSSIFDPVANAKAAAWLYSTYGAGQWQCS